MLVKYNLKEIEEIVVFLGRKAFNNVYLALSWSGTGFIVKFKASRITVDFSDTYNEKDPAYILVEIDGFKYKQTIQSGREKIIIEDLSEEEHELKVTRISESACPIYVSKINLFGKNPKVLKKENPFNFNVEFVGDSMTNGYGNLVVDYSTSEFYTSEQDITKTYAGLTAKHFNANLSAVAVSGQGIYKNWDGGQLFRITDFFNKAVRNTEVLWDFSNNPKFLVLNGGTNDETFGVDNADFKPAVKKFLLYIRECYKNTKIIYFYGLMGNRNEKEIKEVISELNVFDKNFFFLKTSHITQDETGANSHPNVLGHKRAAGELIDFLEKIL